MRKLLFAMLVALMMVLAVGSVAAAGSKLVIKEVEVEVDGDDDTVRQGETVSDEAKPGSKVEIRVEVENNFTSSENLEIEDIEITVTIDDIDDGDELEEDADDFDLKAGRDKSKTLDFDVPMEVGDGLFSVTVEVEGEDENNTEHTATQTFNLEVEKERHELIFTRAAVTPESIQCTRAVDIAVSVLNIGEEDEDEVELTIKNAALGIDFDDTFDVSEGDFDDDQRYSKTFSVTVPEDAEAGSYPIQIAVDYDDGGERESETVDLTVVACEVEEEPSETTTTTTPVETQPEPETTVVIAQPQPPANTVTQPATTTPTAGSAQVIQPSEVQAADDEGSLFDNKWVVVGIIILEVLIVVGGIALVVNLLRNR